jgi:UDP-glucose 4-epimerase
MRCFVTGASGHFGSHLVRRLHADGHTVAILLRSSSRRGVLEQVLPQVEILEGDLSSFSYMAPLIAFAPETVFHLAWSGITAADRNSPQQITGNVRATLALLDAAQRAGAKLFLSTGSQAEYGRVSGAIREDCPLHPETAYGAAKAALSQLVPAFCERAGMRWLWLRIFSVYGPGDAPSHMLPSLIEALLRRERPSLTAGEQQWDYLYIDDVVSAMARAAAAPALSGIFNLASGRAVSLRSVIEQVRDMIDPSLPLGFGELPYAPDQVMHLEGDIARIRGATGWQPEVSLADGLCRTVSWYQAKR